MHTNCTKLQLSTQSFDQSYLVDKLRDVYFDRVYFTLSEYIF